MKKICIFTNVYGTKYQEFIPIYIHSILRSYPDYHVYINVDRKIEQHIMEQISILPNTYNFKIVESLESDLKTKNVSDRSKLKRNMTWLIYDDFFSQFEYLYIGDIDVFICNENPSLLEQHIKHCSALNLSYSNFVRSQYMKMNKKPLILLRIALGRGIKEAISWYKMEDTIVKRMTGLHFVKVEEYFRAVRPLFNKYNGILNKVALGKGSSHENLYLKSNEIMLYDLINESGIGVPPIIPNNYSEMPSDCSSIGFRPMHGMHLGVFRGKKGPFNEFQSVSSELYKGYYKQFCVMRLTDPIYKKIDKLQSKYIKSIIANMDTFYKSIGVYYGEK